MTNADTGNRQGDISVKKPSQEGEATIRAGFENCSEIQRVNHKDVGSSVWTSSENSRVGQGCLCALRFSLLFFLVGLCLPLGEARSAGREVTPQRPVVRGAALGAPMPRVQQYVPPPERPPTAEELAAAQGVEAMLMDHLLQEMRKTVPENEFMPANQGEKIFRQMLDSEYSRILSESGGIGIAELVLAQMRGKR